jgi:nickel-type superoxide dismutase maturation protease
MRPSFEPGDRLLYVRVRRALPGQVVVVRDPANPGRLLVKRVRSVSGTGIDLRGDNEDASTDSRSFGLVPATSVLGRAVYRYAPPNRTGWL